MITHDLGVVAGLCDEVNVLYAGRIVERGERHELFADPRHPYTNGLLGLDPAARRRRRGERLTPSPGRWPTTCPWDPPAPSRRAARNALDVCDEQRPRELEDDPPAGPCAATTPWR